MRSGARKKAPPARARKKLEPPELTPNVRDRLLECTAEILQEGGMGNVSLRAVARRARVSHGAPAYHFKNKAGLLIAFAIDGFRRLVADVRAELQAAGPDPRGLLAAAGKAYIRFALANPERFAVMFRRDMHGAGDPRLEAASGQAFATLAAILHDAAARGLLAEADVERSAAAAWGLAHGIAVLTIEGRIRARIHSASPEELATAAIDFFVDRVLRPGVPLR